ncbi:MAG TPA: efflux RND transporter permease subunit, partial [Desulfobacterales bacterium]|nr:efflux RND transporter permease subunit [Desulfobacterales bacterium]
RDQLEKAIKAVAEKNGGDQLLEGIFTRIHENKIEVNAYLTDPDIRTISTKEVTKEWRKQTGNIIGLQSILFESDRGGPGSGAALSVELAHKDINILDQASSDLAASINDFAFTSDVSNGFTPGKEQLDFQINAVGESLGLTAQSIARQIRNSYQGATALKKQRDRNEVTVRVRLPEHERLSEFDLENMMIRTPQNSYVPLMQVTDFKRGRACTSIERRDGRRIVKVTANVDPIGKVNQITEELNQTILPALGERYPGLTYGYKGRQADRKESMKSMYMGFVFVILGIYMLLAIPFRSYIQPLIVIFAIPFGIVGALGGHILMGYNMSVISIMGLLALSGVIVNDSLVLVDYANKKRGAGHTPFEAVRLAGIRRFRPIMLTTLTTFGGLAPMIFETSRQARFMIPMAISLGFGILFVTVIALLLVPCFYLISEDMKTFVEKRL